MADSICASLSCRMPLHYLLKWQPFRIDALGLITILGAEQVDRAVGRLVPNRYAEYLPLLGAYITASNAFASAMSGFHFYNITPASMTTTDLAGWFQRWCLAQDFSRSFSFVTWTTRDSWTDAEKRQRLLRSRSDKYIGLIIGAFVNSFLLAFTILQGDWWGLANAISMVISIVVRVYVVNSNRDAIDAVVQKMYRPAYACQSLAKCLVTLNDGKQINMFAPSSLVKDLFIDKPAIANRRLYHATRWLGWVGFSTHIITIGMSGLATQIVTVVVIVLSTILTVTQVGCDDSAFSSELRAEITMPMKGQTVRRQDALVALDLTDTEETILLRWNLMPSESNTSWWNDYNLKRKARVISTTNAATQVMQAAVPAPPQLPQNTAATQLLKVPMQVTGTSVSSSSSFGP